MLREATLKFTRDLSARLLIRSVSDDLIRINEESYSESVALTAEDLLGNWHDTPVADLSESHFDAVFSTSPEVVLLVTGSFNVFS